MINPYMHIDVPLGPVGDTILALPAARYIAQNPIYGLKQTNLFSNHVELLALTDITDYCQLVTIRDQVAFPRITLKPEIRNHGHLIRPRHKVDEAFWHIGLEDDVPIEEKNYPKYRKNPTKGSIFSEPIVVISATFSCRRRKFTNESLSELIHYLKKSGYTPVLVGTTRRLWDTTVEYGEYDVDYSGCVNLINRAKPSELFRMLDEAKAVVAPDNGIIHLTGTTDTPIVGFYTIVSPKYLAPIRGNEVGKDCITIEADIPCSDCFTRTDLFYQCYHDTDHAKPADGYKLHGNAKCVKALSEGQLIEAVKEIGIK